MRGLFIALLLVACAIRSGAAVDSFEYIVERGDTLWRIAREHETSYEKLCALNNKPNGWSQIFPIKTVNLSARDGMMCGLLPMGKLSKKGN